jgi:hypothetical protein
MSHCVNEVENNHEQIITLHLSLVLVANLWKTITPSKIFTQTIVNKKKNVFACRKTTLRMKSAASLSVQ